jgi:hypothetical protein
MCFGFFVKRKVVDNQRNWECRVLHKVYQVSIKSLAVVFFLFGGALATEVTAATYYIAPTGSDSGAGTSSSPWKTFGYVVPKLKAGDTLILKDGTYNASNTGFLYVNCDVNAKHGVASSPITPSVPRTSEKLFSMAALVTEHQLKSVTVHIGTSLVCEPQLPTYKAVIMTLPMHGIPTI